MTSYNYASAKFPEPRPFQSSAREKLRAGFAAGHRCQMVMSPTGSGKTILAMFLIQECLMRNKRVIFVADRRTLINQTSEVADSLGLISHGVLMANHWRYNVHLPFQIASAQTLARRDWPDADLIIIDESHTQLKAWTDHIPTCRAAVIGLSATPFSPGLGKLFSNLVNATTMRELTESGVLVPMRVLSCTKVNMKGAATAGGEWTDKAAEERGMDIVGDVVHEWIKHAEGRKTIVFGSTIAHVEGMVREFNSAGIMAVAFTADTTDAERKEILEDFKKPDSILRVLVSVEALAKGFDCIAEGSRVLTHRGLVPIEKVLYNDMLWDGYEFVHHGGVIYKGERDVITYSGITATQDHIVKTAEGWVSFGECARRKIPITRTAYGECCVREDEGHFSRCDGEENNARNIIKREMSVYKVRKSNNSVGKIASFWRRMQKMLYAKRVSFMDRNKSKWNESEMHRSIEQGLQKLWRAWNKIQFQFSKRLCGLDHGEYAAYLTGQKYPTGQNRQQWTLRAWQSSMGKQELELRKYTKGWMGSQDPQIQNGSSRNSVCRQNAAQLDINGIKLGADHRAVLPEVGQAKRRVWDILNAGPRNSFTCEGLLVHNCRDVSCVCDVRPLRKSLSTAIQMWGRGLRSSPETGKTDLLLLDFSGNIVRFSEDYETIYHDGLDALDMGEKLDNTIRKDDEEKSDDPIKCPKCSYSPFRKRCISCGHEIIKQNLIEHEAGEMVEFRIGKSTVGDKLSVWTQCVTLCRNQGKPETAKGRASHLYKSITGVFPRGLPEFDVTPNVTISRSILNKQKANSIAFRSATK